MNVKFKDAAGNILVEYDRVTDTEELQATKELLEHEIKGRITVEIDEGNQTGEGGRKMNSTKIRELIEEGLTLQAESGDQYSGIIESSTYKEAGILSNDEGLIITTDDGSEYQVTITQRR